MDVKKIKTYFPVDFSGKAKGGAMVYIVAEKEFAKTKLDEVCAAKNKAMTGDYEGLYTNTMFEPAFITMGVDLSDFSRKEHDDILEKLVAAMNDVKGIKKIIISDGPININDETAETDEGSDSD